MGRIITNYNSVLNKYGVNTDMLAVPAGWKYLRITLMEGADPYICYDGTVPANDVDITTNGMKIPVSGLELENLDGVFGALYFYDNSGRAVIDVQGEDGWTLLPAITITTNLPTDASLNLNGGVAPTFDIPSFAVWAVQYSDDGLTGWQIELTFDPRTFNYEDSITVTNYGKYYRVLLLTTDDEQVSLPSNVVLVTTPVPPAPVAYYQDINGMNWNANDFPAAVLWGVQYDDGGWTDVPGSPFLAPINPYYPDPTLYGHDFRVVGFDADFNQVTDYSNSVFISG